MKTAIVLAFGLVLALSMRRQAAATRHWTLTLAILCAAATPLLVSIAPAWHWPSGPAARAAAPASAVATTTIEVPAAAAVPPVRGAGLPPAPGTWWARLVLVRWAGALLGLLSLGVGLTRLAWIARHAVPVTSARVWERWRDARARHGITRSVRLVQTDGPPLVMTWGVLRPTVVVPAAADEWSDERLLAVFLHELGHVRRGDWVALMLAEGLRAVDWINPLTWIAARRLRIESELACDDLVLSSGMPAHEYAAHLLAMARLVGADRRRVAQAMSRPSGIERRVQAMLNRHLNRVPGSRLRRTALAAGLAAASVAVAGYGVAAQALTTVSGVVYDPMHLGVPRVAVSLSDPRSEARHEVKTDATGRFEFVGLPPGDYQLEVRSPGFAPSTSGLSVAGRRVDRDVTLAVGSLRETITLSRTADHPEPARPAAPAAAPAAPACQPAAGGGQLRPPMKVRDVHPVYPEGAGVDQGDVVVDARITEDGSVAAAIARDGADPVLAAAAVTAIEQWRFTPTLLNCVPIEVAITTSVRFGQQ